MVAHSEFLEDFVAGGASAIVSKTVTAPLDRVKLLLQTQFVNNALSNPYNGPIDCARRVYREQGILSFWRGNLANVYRYFPNHAVSFALRGTFKNIFVGNANVDKNFWQMFFGNLFAGGAAGGVALVAGYPFDVARTKLAVNVQRKSLSSTLSSSSWVRGGTFWCILTILRTDGIMGLYRGLGVSFVGVVLFKALYLGGYDITKTVMRIDKSQNSTIVARFLLAQAVTTLAGTLCYPLDTIRRRMMMQPKNADGSMVYTSGLQCFRAIVSTEGARGLYQGVSANMIRGVGGAILLVGYDEVKKTWRGTTAALLSSS